MGTCDWRHCNSCTFKWAALQPFSIWTHMLALCLGSCLFWDLIILRSNQALLWPSASDLKLSYWLALPFCSPSNFSFLQWWLKQTNKRKHVTLTHNHGICYMYICCVTCWTTLVLGQHASRDFKRRNQLSSVSEQTAAGEEL